MSAPTPTGNSCSLEDCYTNIFALTDISGIKWRKLSVDPSHTHIDPFEDPVLSTYSKCLQADILCVWRRMIKHSDQRPTDSYGKELWIFWYGDQPSVLDELLPPNLKEQEYGCWDKDSILSYECRTLLFKALHNLIERCLLTKNFVRLGKWFVQPQDPSSPELSSHLSFCFNFFLHGESTVCASIEVKQHPAVTLLSAQHITHAQENQTHLQVILAPYGLNGTLTGQTYRDCDHITRKHLEEWKHFYPVKTEEGRENDINHLPNLVEVIVAGVRMKYPSCYVLLVDPSPLTPPTTPDDAMHHTGIVTDLGMKLMHQHSPFNQRPPEPVSEVTARTSKVYSSQLAERVNQDNCITAGLLKRPSENMSEETIAGTWEYSDPSSRNNCNCVRLRAPKNKAAPGSQGKGAGSGKKGEKGLERQQSRILRSMPFHRRNQMNDDFLHYDVDMFMPQVAAPNTACVPPSGAPTQGVGNSQGSQVVMNNSGEVVASSMDSPASNAPSPLVEPYNQQMDSASNVDPTMPTLSPHPPSKTGEKDTSAKPQTTESLTTNNSALVNGVATDNVFTKPHIHVTNKPENATSPYSWNQQTLENTKANINSWLRSQQRQVEDKGLKRPSLPSVHSDSDEIVTDSLYNFDSVYNWSEYPLKKIKYENKLELLNGVQDIRSNSWQNHKPLKASTPQPPAPDPYEFSDDSSINPASISRSSIRNSRDELFHRPSYKEDEKMDTLRQNGDSLCFREDRTAVDLASLTSPPTTPGTQPASGSLTREADLIPQKSDLDNMFESSDSDSNDDAFMQQSPAGAKVSEDLKTTKTPNTSSGPTDVVGSIAPAELLRMYPTPPSHENNNHVLSPMLNAESSVESSVTEATSISVKQEILGGTLKEELLKDSMCVFKPSNQAQFVSSMKYSPVELATSPLSPPPTVPDYKPSWHFSIPVMEKHTVVTSQYINLPSIENLPSMSSRMPSSAIEASPAMFQNSIGQQRTPMSYELQSPASNASSYLNKTPNSNMNLNHGTNNQIPEVHSLIVNIVLSDSILNLFKDHNFDSCSICVCNMNIKGADLGLYIPNPNPTGDQQYKCSCGFSAVMNKRFGQNAGLFYEDEVEITGVRDNRFEHRKPSLAIDCHKGEGEDIQVNNIEDVTQVVLQLLLGQFSVPYSSCSSASLHNKLVIRATTYPNNTVNVGQLQDGNEITYFALDQGRQAMEHCHPNKLEDITMKSTCLHKWTYIQGVTQIPQNSLESVRLLKSLQPLLQDAIQNKRVTRLWEHTYKLQGPLTWKEFHQLAGRGTDENSEPQPIPSFLVGFDKDAITVSPYAVKFWDKNLLEPYGRPRDIAYVVVTPENDYIMDHIKSFFKELSNVYEWSRLGRHQPVSEKIRDGMLRVGKTMAQKFVDAEVDAWFKQIGDTPLAAKLRLYAQACRHNLGPFLSQVTLDKSMFDGVSQTQRPSHHKPPDINNPNTENLNNSGDDRDGSEGSGHRDGHDDVDDSYECPAVVVYIINPFSYAAQDWDDLNRLAVIGLLRCYNEVLSMLPENMKNNIYLQIVPLQTIIDNKENRSQYQYLKNLAFSVFSSCRWNLTHNILGRSLTGFGPAAAAEILLKHNEGTEGISQRLYSPPFVLAPVKDKQEQLAESCSDKRENSNILLCVYCLTEDQRWLLACCTDERGEMMETCAINIEIPNRNRRKKTSARKIGLGKLWEFLLGVISLSVQPTRLVIGRFGRIGHGELKGWSGLLSKKNIQRSSKHMREKCSQCSYQVNGEYPCILSACLTSLEQQPSFSVMPDCVKPEEKQGNNCSLQTPRDASCSHILVFPTSATAQANSHQIQLDSTGGMDLGTNHLEFGVDLSDINIQDDFESNTDGFGSLMDVFVQMTENSPPGSPRHASNPGSPGLMDLGRNSPTKINGLSVATTSSCVMDPQDDNPNLLQQPLAMGYYISTAETGPLPRWFWSACPESDLAAVKFFKAALHIHCSSNQDDLLHQAQNNRNCHPLDSSLTCDVLRFVLEKYNSLSWLTYDPAKNDRQSCLPIHMLVLMQMYHAMNAYV